MMGRLRCYIDEVTIDGKQCQARMPRYVVNLEKMCFKGAIDDDGARYRVAYLAAGSTALTRRYAEKQV
jgi:hypothetical protein